MRILNRYLSLAVLRNIMLLTLGLLAMFTFFDFIDELENLGKGTYTLSKIALYVVLSIPGHIYEVAPTAVLLGAIYTLSVFSKNAELNIYRISGLSIFNIAMMLLKIGLLFAVLTFLVGEFVTPKSEKRAQRIKLKATESVVAQDFRTGFWVKDGNNFINVGNVLPDATLLDIRSYTFNDKFVLNNITEAKESHFEKNTWVLKDLSQTFFEGNQIRVATTPVAEWKTLIRPELLNVFLVLPEKMSVQDLSNYISHLRANKQKSNRYQVALYAKFIYPIACVVMMLLALPLGFLNQRNSSVSNKIFIGIMLGLVYQITNRFFGHLGFLNDWNPLFSATAPTALFTIISITMLLRTNRN